MVNHVIRYGYPPDLVTVNGHMASAGFNETAGNSWVGCTRCGWVGRSFKGRWAEKANEQWRLHAGDIAMGVDIVHGQTGNNCYCSECIRARVLEAEGK
jgi:hypothetical protein